MFVHQSHSIEYVVSVLQVVAITAWQGHIAQHQSMVIHTISLSMASHITTHQRAVVLRAREIIHDHSIMVTGSSDSL